MASGAVMGRQPQVKAEHQPADDDPGTPATTSAASRPDQPSLAFMIQASSYVVMALS
jgi:hypothetical protein